jgi:hypothetical protein
MDIRSPEKLALLWQWVLPLENCECEISPLLNAEWLAVKSHRWSVDYTRLLKNAMTIGNSYFAIRINSTIEIYQAKQSEWSCFSYIDIINENEQLTLVN